MTVHVQRPQHGTPPLQVALFVLDKNDPATFDAGEVACGGDGVVAADPGAVLRAARAADLPEPIRAEPHSPSPHVSLPLAYR